VALPAFVVDEFRSYLRCGRLEHGFIRVKCDGCRHEHLVAFSCKRRGFYQPQGDCTKTGATNIEVWIEHGDVSWSPIGQATADAQ